MRYIFMSYCLTVCMFNKANIGCMDNSYHLAKKGDTKAMHYVSCNCPCNQKTILRKGQCLTCQHYHLPHPCFMMSHNQETMHIESYGPLTTASSTYVLEENTGLIKEIITRYQRSERRFRHLR